MSNPLHDSHGRFAAKAPGERVSKAKDKPAFSPFDELGRPSKVTYGGTLYQDYIPALTGKQCIRTM